MIMLRVEDGKIVEEWDSYDHLSTKVSDPGWQE